VALDFGAERDVRRELVAPQPPREPRRAVARARRERAALVSNPSDMHLVVATVARGAGQPLEPALELAAHRVLEARTKRGQPTAHSAKRDAKVVQRFGVVGVVGVVETLASRGHSVDEAQRDQSSPTLRGAAEELGVELLVVQLATSTRCSRMALRVATSRGF